MPSSPFWSEWDGRGMSEAVAWTVGWVDDADEAIKDVRRLGVLAREIDLRHGWVGSVDEDDILDACTEDGEALVIEGLFAAPESIQRVTFAFVVVV